MLTLEADSAETNRIKKPKAQEDENGFRAASSRSWNRHLPLCHLDRSEAEWRDLCVDAPAWECFSAARGAAVFFTRATGLC